MGKPTQSENGKKTEGTSCIWNVLRQMCVVTESAESARMSVPVELHILLQSSAIGWSAYSVCVCVRACVCVHGHTDNDIHH